MVAIKIENDRIVEVQIGQTKMVPKNILTMDEHYSEMRKHAGYFEENFDIVPVKGKETKVASTNGYKWDDEELGDFLRENTPTQDTFLEALMINPEKMYVEDILKHFKTKGNELKPRAFAGVTSGFTRRSVYYGVKEPFVDSLWDEKGTYYTVKKQYREIIKRHLDNL